MSVTHALRGSAWILVLGSLTLPAIAQGAAGSSAGPPGGAYRFAGQLGAYRDSGSAASGRSYASAASASRRGVTYAASNSNFDPVVLQLSRKGTKVTRVVETYRGYCESGGNWPEIGDSTAGLKISKSGSFSGTRTGQFDLGSTVASAAETVKGKVRGSKISASQTTVIAITDKESGQVVDMCGYHATAKLKSGRGRVYGGATSQHGAVVVELSPSRKAVKHLHIGWQAQCTPDGTFTIGDTLTNFRLRGGLFGDAFSQNYGRDGGGQNTFDYTASGKVGPAKASGQLSVKVTFKDAAGAQEAACDTGALSWQARSG